MPALLTIKHRVPIMLLAMINLLAGLVAGLIRIGWQMKVANLASAHGAIMVGGFLGTLIALEKLIPLKNRLLLIIPALSGGSVLLFLLGMPQEAALVLTISSLGLVGVFVFYLFKHRRAHYAVIFAGGVCWFLGNVLLYSKHFYPLSFPLWLGFILFVIAGERLELMTFLPVSKKAKAVLLAIMALYVVSMLFPFHRAGNVIAGASLIGISLWLLTYDAIRIGILKTHLTRFVSIALLCGYISLMICGMLMISVRDSIMGYDIVVHAFFLGFAFSMIFAHGPIILPGVLGISEKPYHKIYFLFLILLQSSWLMRAFADSMLDFELRQISGVISAVAIVGYFLSLVTVSIRQRHAKTV